MNKQSNQEFEEEDYFTTTHNIEVRLKFPFQSYVMNMAKVFEFIFFSWPFKMKIGSVDHFELQTKKPYA